MSEAALVRRLLAGEDAAFDEFFAAYFPPLYRFALSRLGGNEDAAEEAVQRALIRALSRLHTYRGEAALLTWLCALCRHEMSGWTARESRGVDVPLEGLAAADREGPEALLQRRELGRLVHATLDELPGRYGEALEWKYIEDLSVDEIARRLGVGYKAAESLLSRARAAFRDSFALRLLPSSEEP